MFKKKVPTRALAAAAVKAAPSSTKANTTSTTSNATSSPPRQPAAARGANGGKARTLALIEKHRKILEEAERQREEMESITQEQTRLHEKKAQLDRAAAAAQGKASSKASSPVDTKAVKPDTFSALIDQFLAATQPLADLDETIQGKTTEGLTSSSSSSDNAVAAAAVAAAARVTATTPQPKRLWQPPVVTYRSFAASLACPKKFYLLQNRSDLIPKASLGDMMHFDDSVGFNELARRWDRLQFGSRAYVVKESDFAQAVQHTEQLIVAYFQGPYATLGEQAPTLTIHRPAFAVELANNNSNNTTTPAAASSSSTNGSGKAPLTAELRARPAVIRYRPKENQWVFIDAQAVIDPVSTPVRITNSIQKFHFTILCFRLWLTQPHLPIELRKKFLQVNLDSITTESLRGHSLEASARPAAPIDMKRSGLLHIRQFFPGPATLVDCAPPQLVKFIQRLSLEGLLELDSAHYGREGGGRGQPFAHGFNGGGGGAFDLKNCHSSVWRNSALTHELQVVESTAKELSKLVAGQGRVGRSQKHKDDTVHRLFEAEQRLLEEMLRRHTLPLMQQQQEELQQQHSPKLSIPGASALTSFSGLLGDEGFVRASTTTAADADEHKKGNSVKAAAKKLKGGKVKQKSAVDTEETEDADDEGSAGPLTSAEAAGVPCYGKHIGPQCLRGGDACPFFVEGMCLPRKVEDPIRVKDNHLFTLPSTSLSRKSAWWAEGKRTIGDVLAAYKGEEQRMRLTHAQLRYAEALTQGLIALNPKEVDAFFDKIRYPLFVIDFEAVQFALPPFPKEVAYQSIPFQFSLDVFQHDVLTEEPTHYNYLHFGKGCSPNTDPRPGCVAELLRIVRLEREKKRVAMAASGELDRLEAERAAAAAEAAAAVSSGRRTRKPKAPKPPKITKTNPLEEPLQPFDGSFVAHFASFEKSCLEKLGQLEEQYKEEIKSFFFLDTLDLIKKACIHPNMHGSNSLKKVLPALCPDFQYGVFGSEVAPSEAAAGGVDDTSGNGGGNGGGVSEGQDEQKGENAMGVYRLWYHLEGGGTVQDLQRATRGLTGSSSSSSSADASDTTAAAWTESVRTTMSKEEREQMWHTLRNQLLEYCSLDTKALYEIMREIHAERAAIPEGTAKDKNGWVFVKPSPREMDL